MADFRAVLTVFFRGRNRETPKAHAEAEPVKFPGGMDGDKEEQKVARPKPEKRKASTANLDRVLGGSEDKSDTDLTPRLANPVMMVKKRESSDADDIPCERYGPVKVVPLWEVHNITRAKCKQNRSQLLSNNRSTYCLYTPSLGSHE